MVGNAENERGGERPLRACDNRLVSKNFRKLGGGDGPEFIEFGLAPEPPRQRREFIRCFHIGFSAMEGLEAARALAHVVAFVL